MNQALPPAPTLPTIEHAIQFVGPGQLVHNRAKIVPVPGPTQLLVRVEAVGICSVSYTHLDVYKRQGQDDPGQADEHTADDVDEGLPAIDIDA